MPGVKIALSASHSPKTLVRTAVQAYWITFLSSKANGNRCDLHEKLIIIRKREFDVGLHFNMLDVNTAAWVSHSPKTLVRTAVQAYWITFLSSKANGNRCDLHEKLIIIRKREFDVGLHFNMLGVNTAAWVSHSPKTLVRTAVQAYWITLLSSKGNENRCQLHEKPFIKIRTLEFDI